MPPGARGPLFHLVSIGAVVLITVYYLRLGGTRQERWALIGLPLVLGGAIGNYVDRLARGFVIDFLEAHWKDVYTWPSFNVADSAIVVGVILLLIDGIVRRSERRLPRRRVRGAPRMLPTLIDIRFDTPFAQGVLYLVAVLLFGYGIWAGWRNAPGSVDRKTGKELPPTRSSATQRAVIYGCSSSADRRSASTMPCRPRPSSGARAREFRFTPTA